MNNIDRRIVEMQFDNSKFDSNVKSSVESLDKLKESLKLEDSARELENLSRASRNFNLDTVASAATAITSKFSIMGTVADEALRRIANSAFNMLGSVKGFVDSLTIDPVHSGFQEYETQINSVQTILSNTRDDMVKAGYTDAQRLDIVNDRLDQLNTYADKTIYNFTEMTRNIGTFTAAGVELDTAVDSIQGIANLAAVSGSNSEQASRAMYQMSQAISTGSMKLMDWNSVVNAGMGGELFQKALQRTAAAAGVTDKMFKELQAGKTSFRDSLQSGWLTSEILTKTLEQFSWDFEALAKAQNTTVEEVKKLKIDELISEGYTRTQAEEIVQLAEDATDAATKVKTFTQLFDTLKEAAQSGWTQTWEYIIGDFDEAKEMLTAISKFFGGIIDGSSEARNALLKIWHDKGGRNMLFNNDPEKGPLGALWNTIYGIQNLVVAVKDEFANIFPKMTWQNLLDFTKRIQNATAAFKALTENAEFMTKFRRIIAGIGAAIDVVRMGIGFLWSGVKRLFGFVPSAAGGLLDILAGIGDKLVEFRNFIKNSGAFQSFLAVARATIDGVRNLLVGTFTIVIGWIRSIWDALKRSGIFPWIGKQFASIVNWVKTLGSRLQKAGIISGFRKWFAGLQTGIAAGLKTVGAWTNGVIDFVRNSVALKTAWLNFKNFFAPAIRLVTDFASRLWSGIKNFFGTRGRDNGIIGTIKTKLSAFAAAFKGWFPAVKSAVSTAWTGIKSHLRNFFTVTIPKFFTNTIPSFFRSKSGIWNGIVQWFSNVWSAVKSSDIVKSLSARIQGIGTAIRNSNLFTSISDWLSGVWQSIKGSRIVSGISEWFRSIDLKAWFANIWTAISSFDVSRISEWFSGILSWIRNFDFSGVVDWFKGLWEKIKGIDFGSIVEKIKGFISSFSSSNDDVKRNLGKNDEGTGFLDSIIAGFKKVIDWVLSVDWTKVFWIGTGIVGLFSLFAGLRGIGKIGDGLKSIGKGIKNFGKKAKTDDEKSTLETVSTAVLKIAASIGILVAAIWVLGRMDGEELKKGLLIIGGLMAALLAVSFVFKKIDVDGKGILMLAIAISMLGAAIWAIAKIDTKDAWIGIRRIGVIMAEIALFSRLAGDKKSNGLMLVSMAGSVLILVFALKRLAAMTSNDLIKGVAAVGALLLEIAIASRIAGGRKTKGMISMAIAVGILVAAVKSLSKMRPKALTKGLLALGGIMMAFAVMAKLSTGTTFGTALSLLAMAATMVLFVETFKSLDGINLNDLLKYALGLSTLLLAMAVSMKILSSIPVIGAIKGIANLAILIAGIGAIVTGLGWLSTVWPDMSTYLEAGGDAFGLLGRAIGKFVGGIASGFVEGFDLPQLGTDLSDFMTNVGPFLEGAKAIDPNIGPNIASLAKGIASIGSTEFWQAVGEFVTRRNFVSEFSYDIMALIYGLRNYASAANGFSTLASPEDMQAAIDTAGALVELGKSLPKIYGFWPTISGWQDLGKFGDDIGLVGAGLKKYAEGVGGMTDKVSESDLKAASAVATGLASINNSLPKIYGFWPTISGWQDLGKFGDDIGLVGAGLKKYAEGVSGMTDKVSESDLSAAAVVATGLASINNSLPKIYGFWPTISGWQDLGKFGDDIGLVGAGLKKYAEGISGMADKVSESDLNAAAIAASGLAELNQAIPKIRGFAPTISGWQDLGKFGDDIGLVGAGLKKYAENVGDLDTTVSKADLDLASYAALNLAIVANSLPQIGGFLGALEGDQDLGGFGDDLGQVGAGLKTFAEAIAAADVDQQDAQKALDVLGVISTFKTELNKEGSIFDVVGSWFAGNTEITLTTLANDLAMVGTNLKTFAEAITSVPITSEETEDALGIIGVVQNFKNSLDPQGGVFKDIGSWFTGNNDLETTTSKMVNVATNLKTFSDTLSTTTYSSEAFTAAKEAITSFRDFAKEINGDPVSLVALEDAAYNLGQIFLTKVADSIEGGTSSIATQVINLAPNDQVTYSTWYATGIYLGYGLQAGISAMAGSIAAAASSAASGALNSICVTWSINSPSKEGYRLGAYLDQGIANGIGEYSRVVTDQAALMSQNVVDSASTLLRGANGSVFDYIDPNPTIRPVMDLSNIQNGVSAINGMLHSDTTYTTGMFSDMQFSRGVSAMTFDGSRIAGGFTDRNIVSKLDALQGRIGELGAAVSNMQLVLDTGVLVGETSAMIDNQLGVLAMRRERGN